MPVLHVENVPAEVLRRIEDLARADRIPVSDAAVRLLEQALDRQRPSRANVLQVLESIRRDPIQPSPDTPDSVQLLREDRAR
jgi:hypothetical protein